MKPYTYSTYFPKNFVEVKNEQIDTADVKKVFKQIDWILAFEDAENLFYNREDETTKDNPFFILKKNKTENELHFTIARNDILETKILMFFNWIEVKNCCFGLLKKEVNLSANKLLETPDEALNLIEAFQESDTEFRKKLNSMKSIVIV